MSAIIIAINMSRENDSKEGIIRRFTDELAERMPEDTLVTCLKEATDEKARDQVSRWRDKYEEEAIDV